MTTNNHATGSKIAQLFADVIVRHAPWTAEIAEDAKRRRVEQFLEELEQHTSEITGPLIDRLMTSPNMSPEIATMLKSIHDPEHQVSAIAGQFLIYGVGFAIAQQLTTPFLQGIANTMWSENTFKPIDPANLVAMAVRGLDPANTDVTPIPGVIFDIAAESGYSQQNFQAMVDAAGSPPSPQDLFAMFRRKIVNMDGLRAGLRQGDTKDSWIDDFVKLAYSTLSPIDMVRAAVQAQLTYDEANQYAIELGLEPPGYVDGNPDWFKIAFDIAGRPPGPAEMGHAANRGLIDWEGTGPDALTFQQAIAESDIKTKWTPVLQKLAEYFPPPSETKTLLMHGGITIDTAIKLWQQAGISPEIAKALAHTAQIEQITQDKLLAKGDILTAVQERIMSDTDALGALAQLGYRGDVAAALIEMAHWRYNLETLRTAVRRIATLFTSFKIDANECKIAFTSLGVPDKQATELLTILGEQRAAEVVIPTAAQITGAFAYGIIDQQQAITDLGKLGYQPHDAWLVLSVRHHAKLPDEPAPDTKGPGV